MVLNKCNVKLVSCTFNLKDIEINLLRCHQGIRAGLAFIAWDVLVFNAILRLLFYNKTLLKCVCMYVCMFFKVSGGERSCSCFT